MAPTCGEGARRHSRARSDSQGPGLQLGLKQRPSLRCSLQAVVGPDGGQTLPSRSRARSSVRQDLVWADVLVFAS